MHTYRQRKYWYKIERMKLTNEAKTSKSLIDKICLVLSDCINCRFVAIMDLYRNSYEGHIMSYGNVDPKDDGMIFWGGYFSRKTNRNAESKAWISLLEDCIGIGEDAEIHNLTKYIREIYEINIDFNCSSIEELKLKLAIYGK